MRPLSALLAACLTGCAAAPPDAPAPAPLSPAPATAAPAPSPSAVPAEPAPAAPSASASIQRFGMDLYREISTRSGNLALSPASVAIALHMTRVGAEGVTAEQMADVLHVGKGGHDAFGAMLKNWNGAHDDYQLVVANQVFANDGTALKQPFVDTLGSDYGAKIELVPFETKPEPARARINQWVAKKTAQKIRDLLPPGSIDGNTRLVLTNAIYFKGTWKKQFDAGKTKPADFFAAGGTKKVPMMHKKTTMKFVAADGMKMVSMPYEGDELSMTLLVPDAEDGVAAVEKKLVDGGLTDWDEAARMAEVTLSLPRFKLEAKEPLALKSTLKTLGMVDAFDAEKADFTRMADVKPLFVGDAFHKAFVEVNEKGTEAAAATGVVMETKSIKVPLLVTADRPFVFLIRDEEGTVLFMGRVADPG